jgi:hypothetical protein
MLDVKELPQAVSKVIELSTKLVTENPPNTIFMWNFKDAPEEFKNISTNGGDEDWVALVPEKAYFPFIHLNSFDSDSRPQKLILNPINTRIKSVFYTLYIGSHA